MHGKLGILAAYCGISGERHCILVLLINCPEAVAVTGPDENLHNIYEDIINPIPTNVIEVPPL